MKRSKQLKRSLSAAPVPVQRRLRTTRASAEDVRGLLQHPYSAKGQWTRAKVWKASIAGFFPHVKSRPKEATSMVIAKEQIQLEQVVEDDVSTPRERSSVWQQDWLKWEPEKRSKAKRLQKAVPANKVKRVKVPSQEGKSEPIPTPQVQLREMVPLVSGVSPNIPQWALPFPQVRRNGRDSSAAGNSIES